MKYLIEVYLLVLIFKIFVFPRPKIVRQRCSYTNRDKNLGAAQKTKRRFFDKHQTSWDFFFFPKVNNPKYRHNQHQSYRIFLWFGGVRLSSSGGDVETVVLSLVLIAATPE